MSYAPASYIWHWHDIRHLPTLKIKGTSHPYNNSLPRWGRSGPHLKLHRRGSKNTARNLRSSPGLHTPQVTILWCLCAASPTHSDPTRYPTGPNPGCLQMSFEHALAGHSSFGGIRKNLLDIKPAKQLYSKLRICPCIIILTSKRRELTETETVGGTQAAATGKVPYCRLLKK